MYESERSALPATLLSRLFETTHNSTNNTQPPFRPPSLRPSHTLARPSARPHTRGNGQLCRLTILPVVLPGAALGFDLDDEESMEYFVRSHLPAHPYLDR